MHMFKVFVIVIFIVVSGEYDQNKLRKSFVNTDVFYQRLYTGK